MPVSKPACVIFDSLTIGTEKVEEKKEVNSPIFDQLHALWQRGLLSYETFLVHRDTMSFYRLPPTMRTFVEQFLTHTSKREILLTRFGEEYAKLVSSLHRELDRSVFAAPMALVLREDIERGASYMDGVEQG